MTSNNELIDTAPNDRDRVHTLIRTLIGALPVVGSTAAELFQLLIAPPLEKRRQKWMESIAERLLYLEEQQQGTIECIFENEVFIDTFMEASHAAIRTSQVEKLQALRNAVLNSATPHAPDESRQQIFIRLIDSFTVWHLRILHLLSNPSKVFRNLNKQMPQYSISASVSQLLVEAYPELGNQRDLYDFIARDLFDQRLIGLESFHGMMSPQGVIQKKTTDFGDQFLQLISEVE
jgi:hypothetical protein